MSSCTNRSISRKRHPRLHVRRHGVEDVRTDRADRTKFGDVLGRLERHVLPGVTVEQGLDGSNLIGRHEVCAVTLPA